MFTTYTISTDSGLIELSALKQDHKFFLPSLNVKYHEDDDLEDMVVDSEKYLLKNFINHMNGVPSELFSVIYEDEREDLCNVFKEAIKIGFFDQVTNDMNLNIVGYKAPLYNPQNELLYPKYIIGLDKDITTSDVFSYDTLKEEEVDLTIKQFVELKENGYILTFF